MNITLGTKARIRTFLNPCFVIVLVLTLQVHSAHGLPVRSFAKEAIEKIVKIVGRKAGTNAAEDLATYGSRKAVQKTVMRVNREGGEEAVEKLVRLTKKHGVDTLRTVDNAEQPTGILKAVDSLPDDVAKRVVPRLAGKQGRELARVTTRYGSDVLKAEAIHPGLGVRMANNLGADGLELLTNATKDQALTMSRHADDIAALPGRQKERVLDLLKRKTDEMVRFMGRFTENNPGKVLFTGAATGIILANDDKILGSSQIVYDEDGDPHLVTEPGLVDRSINKVLDYILPIVLVGLALYIALRLYYICKREKKKSAA